MQHTITSAYHAPACVFPLLFTTSKGLAHVRGDNYLDMDKLLDLRELLRDFVFRPAIDVTEKDIPDLSGKTYLVTGASSGIGFYSAKFLAGAGAKVYLTGRSLSKLEDCLEKIREQQPCADVHGLQVDYSSPETIQKSIEPIVQEEKLNGIIHNAGMNHADATVTKYGYTETLVVNAIGPQIVQRILDPLLLKTVQTAGKDNVRVIWVASSAHFLAPPCGGIDWDDLNNTDLGGRGYAYYGETKTFSIYQAILWGQKYLYDGIVSVAVHPGIITSDIRRNAPGQKSPYEIFCRPTEYGAYAEIMPLFIKLSSARNGTYFVPFGQRARIREDIELAAYGPRGQKAWRWLQKESGKYIQ